MIDPKAFADKQLELATELVQYVAEHPEVDEMLPEKSEICFQIEGETEFNRYSRELAEHHHGEEGAKVVLVRIKGLALQQGSRLINPVIEPARAIA